MVDAEDVIRVTLENLKAEGTEVTPAQEKMVRDTVHRWLVLTEVGLPAIELHADQQDRKLAVWEVLFPYMADTKTWGEIEDALTDEDWARIQELCGDQTVGEVLGLEQPGETSTEGS
jgi:hypothetical protein